MAESEADLENGDVVANYTRPRRPYKVAFTGIYGVGKTSLFRKILNEPPTFRANGTREEIFHKDKTVIPLEFWDTADMERHGSITQSYYRGSMFVLLVYSATDDHSLHRLRGIASNVRANEPVAKLILVRNKTDLPIGDEGVSEKKEKEFLREMKKTLFGKSFWTSANTGEGIKDLLDELAKHSLKMFKSRGRMQHEDNENQFLLDTEAVRRENKAGYSCCS